MVKYQSLPANTPYFHTQYRQALPTPLGAPYEILHTTGRGHYVGTVLSVIQNQPGWFGEGDDFFYVDGKKKANIEGTGTEDYFNDAWSLRVADGPYFGVTVADGTDLGSRMTAYRWHIVDPIPFTKELRFDIERRLDVQQRRNRAERVRRARRPLQHRGILVPARDCLSNAVAAIKKVKEVAARADGFPKRPFRRRTQIISSG